MVDRPPKNRRREIGEVRKAGKFPRMGTVMTCSICRGANQNKRNCPNNSKPKCTPTPTQESSTGKKRSRGQYERATSNNTGTRRGVGSGYKIRPRVVGQGVFVFDTGYTCINLYDVAKNYLCTRLVEFVVNFYAKWTIKVYVMEE
ncbi:hypothetical protein H5410_041039 [Solanum commersonii]|uniref:Uncharacterized protein n=1 Tax=Solanum commersonii TaxID=4109 RepID=A0A9J5XRW6_SOLCO|nr:hypothetical protein H5410_041039 [Solanum commersonii]